MISFILEIVLIEFKYYFLFEIIHAALVRDQYYLKWLASIVAAQWVGCMPRTLSKANISKAYIVSIRPIRSMLRQIEINYTPASVSSHHRDKMTQSPINRKRFTTFPRWAQSENNWARIPWNSFLRTSENRHRFDASHAKGPLSDSLKVLKNAINIQDLNGF